MSECKQTFPKKIVLVDIDQVINDMLDIWISYLNKKYPNAEDLSKKHLWSMSERFPSLSDKQRYSCLNKKSFWKKVRPRDGAVKYLKALVEDPRFEVYLCTASHLGTLTIKYKYFLKKYYPFIPWTHFICSYKKQMLKADYLIDDGLHNLIGGSYTKIVFDMPYNRDTTDKDLIRCCSWEEIYSFLDTDYFKDM